MKLKHLPEELKSLQLVIDMQTSKLKESRRRCAELEDQLAAINYVRKIEFAVSYCVSLIVDSLGFFVASRVDFPSYFPFLLIDRPSCEMT